MWFPCQWLHCVEGRGVIGSSMCSASARSCCTCWVSLTPGLWLVPGSGRVTFNNQRSYLKAVTAAFVEIKTTKFTKKVSGADGAAWGWNLCDG